MTRGKTRSVKGRPGVYNVMYAYADEQAGLLAGAAGDHAADAPGEGDGGHGPLDGGPHELALPERRRRRLMFFALACLVILGGIPWPGLQNGRPLFRL